MELKYEYYFVKHGVTREDHSNINNEIWLDVGNKIAIGTFDHHNAVTDYQSTVDTLFNELDLLEQTKNQLDEVNWIPADIQIIDYLKETMED